MNKSVHTSLKRFSVVAKKEIAADARCIVFGSYAKGLQKKWSDIDVAVIVSKIKDVLEGEKRLRLGAFDIDERINPFIFTLEDMRENSPLVWEVKKYGKEIGEIARSQIIEKKLDEVSELKKRLAKLQL